MSTMPKFGVFFYFLLSIFHLDPKTCINVTTWLLGLNPQTKTGVKFAANASERFHFMLHGLETDT